MSCRFFLKRLSIITMFFCFILFMPHQAESVRLLKSKTSRDAILMSQMQGGKNPIRLKEDLQSASIRFSLGGTGSISGRVTEYPEDGNQAVPLSNVWITLYESDDPYWAGRHAWNYVTDTSTDSQGYYTFNGLFARQYRIQVYNQTVGDTHYVEANLYNVQVFEGATTPNMDLQLRKAGLIWGYVKTTDGIPITRANIIAHLPFTHDGNGWHHYWEIDANGRYELWLLPSPGKFYPIHVQEALIPGSTYKVYGGSEYIEYEQVLSLEDYGYEILGSSTETHTFDGAYNYYVIIAEPYNIIKIDAICASDDSCYGSFPSESSGDVSNTYYLSGEPDGQYATLNYDIWWDDEGAYILLQPDPNNTSLTVYIAGGSQTNPEPKYYETKMAPELYQATLEGVHGPDFYLNEGGKITGKVINDQGEGIEDVHIRLQAGPIDYSYTWTGLNGYYTIIGVPQTDNAYAMIDTWDLAIEQEGIKYSRGEEHVGPFVITPGATVEAPDMTMLVAGTLAGQVTDENGTPIVGVEIYVDGHDIDGYWSDQGEIYTDAFGQYTVDYIAPGIYNVSTEKSGWAMGKKTGVVITSDHITDCDLILKDANQGAMVSGKITNYDEIKPKDPNGIALPQYDETDYEDYGIPFVEVLAVSADIDFKDDDYLSIGDATFEGWAEPDDGYADYFQISETEIPGNYEMILPAGAFDLAIAMGEETENGFYAVLHDWTRVSLTTGSKLTNINLTANTTFGTIMGDISAPSGYSLKTDRTIILAFDENDPTHSAFPNAISAPEFGTQYYFGQIPVGTYTLRAITDGFVTQVYEHISVTEGVTLTQNISFTSGGALSGEITDKDTGDPIEGAVVKILENAKTAVTNSSGSYTITGLAAGDYTVNIKASGFKTLSQTVTIIEGQTAEGDFTMDSTVGSIAGTVTAGGENVNGATVVAYNTIDKTFNTDITLGGAFDIIDLTPGEYLLAVDAQGFNVTIYPADPNDPNATISLGESENIDQSEVSIELLVSPPEFTVSSSVSLVSSDTSPVLSMTFRSDVALDSDPNFIVVSGNGTLSDPNKESPTEFKLSYQADSNDVLVKIKIEGTYKGQLGSKTCSFEVGSALIYTASTNVTNATGGDVTMMGTQDNTKVYVPPFALAGADNTEAVSLTIERYGDPGDSVEDSDDQSVSAVYDFNFEDGNVSVASNKKVTVTMSFELPAGMTQKEFEDTFEVRYFNVNTQSWETDGISNTKINWNNYTITFDVAHLTKFAAFISAASTTPGGDGDGGSSGCFIGTAFYECSIPGPKRILSISKFRISSSLNILRD